MTDQIATVLLESLPDFDPSLLAVATDEELSRILDLYREAIRITSRNKLESYYPEDGPLRRELYPKHAQFFAAGSEFRERCMLAGNRVGKTEGVGGYEMALHLTGRYPSWWIGRKFERPVRAWAAGDTAKTVRDIIQRKLLGAHGQHGTGLIPGDDLISTAPWAGVPDAVEMIYVRHLSGGESLLQLKSYDQKREAFQGTEQDIIWLDEECPEDIYTECLLRTMTTSGLLMLTFTPLCGLTPLVQQFMPGYKQPGQSETSGQS